MVFVPRFQDEKGHLWPQTGRFCWVCIKPLDPVVEDGVHPLCYYVVDEVGEFVPAVDAMLDDIRRSTV